MSGLMELLFLMFIVLGVVFLLRGIWGFVFASPGGQELEERLNRTEARLQEVSREVRELQDQVATLLIELDDEERAFKRLDRQLEVQQEEHLRERLQRRRE